MYVRLVGMYLLKWNGILFNIFWLLMVTIMMALQNGIVRLPNLYAQQLFGHHRLFRALLETLIIQLTETNLAFQLFQEGTITGEHSGVSGS